MRGKHTIIGAIVLVLFLAVTFGFQVAPLPSGNLVFNPWFRDFDEPNTAGFSGWTVDEYWGASQKVRNPSPDNITSDQCGHSTDPYCGTMARLVVPFGNVPGDAVAGVPASVSQVVVADPSVTKFTFGIWWVTLKMELAEVRIYGGDFPNGSWNLVWTPYSHSFLGMVSRDNFVYRHTGYSETTLDRGYSHYKIELYALPVEGESGVKLTGVYFGPSDSSGIPPPPPVPECLGAGEVCSVSSDCCSDECLRGKCIESIDPPPPVECLSAGEACSEASDCCSEDCRRGICQGDVTLPPDTECKAVGEPCSVSPDCCSDDCRRGRCVDFTADPSPNPEICSDGIDNDRDGEIDCSDADCRRDAKCAECIILLKGSGMLFSARTRP